VGWERNSATWWLFFFFLAVLRFELGAHLSHTPNPGKGILEPRSLVSSVSFQFFHPSGTSPRESEEEGLCKLEPLSYIGVYSSPPSTFGCWKEEQDGYGAEKVPSPFVCAECSAGCGGHRRWVWVCGQDQMWIRSSARALVFTSSNGRYQNISRFYLFDLVRIWAPEFPPSMKFRIEHENNPICLEGL
jgi:hypothetical protein